RFCLNSYEQPIAVVQQAISHGCVDKPSPVTGAKFQHHEVIGGRFCGLEYVDPLEIFLIKRREGAYDVTPRHVGSSCPVATSDTYSKKVGVKTRVHVPRPGLEVFK